MICLATGAYYTPLLPLIYGSSSQNLFNKLTKKPGKDIIYILFIYYLYVFIVFHHKILSNMAILDDRV